MFDLFDQTPNNTKELSSQKINELQTEKRQQLKAIIDFLKQP